MGRLLATFPLGDACLDQLADERYRQRLVGLKMKRGLGLVVPSEIIGQRSQRRPAEREVRTALRSRAESGNHDPVEAKRWNSVAYAFLGLGNDGSNRVAELAEHKAFNHIYAAELTTHGLPAGAKDRRALVIAGNEAKAKAEITAMIDRFGFDVVDAGPLRESWRIQRDTPGYGPRRNAQDLRADLAAAKR